MPRPLPLRQRLPDVIALMRLDRPIGIYLLWWPTAWAVWIAGAGSPSLSVVLVFALGVVLMRSAGCVINDYADRHLDGQVRRTAQRPLATGRLQARDALGLFVLLLLLAASLLLWLPRAVFWWSLVAVALATLYPFMKRYTYLPQVVLGAAFSWAIPMAYVAQGQTPDAVCWLLYLANLAWTVAYDTQYAMADREDDLTAGIKSTAILFGELDRTAILILQGLCLTGLWLAGDQLQLGWAWTVGLLAAGGQFAWQWWLTRDRDPAACLRAFLANHWVGLWLFVALLAGLLQQPTG